MKQQEELLRRLSNIEKLLEERKTKPLNLVEAAKYLSISQSNLYRLTSQRKVPVHKPNGKYLYFFKEELDEWVRSTSSEKSKGKPTTAGKSEKKETQEDETEDEPP
jgi:excisionase family DNA binding protein